ncbi:NAD(P)H-dependent glycerol-3-phosphate dehydrogenase [Spiroplasma endosymbiont of Crioceris asparagi]|uniref:NAD(P)H-dependent glycerol-3-phosphate dehydrogenase n=1 Tax=Spiroplasma endosymbiont of Crioceris asparagi TaxID=3066286 RepID=UPI0030CE46E1
MDIKNFTVIGTGAYGTVLANVLSDNGHSVTMYGIVQEEVDDIMLNHRNSKFFQDLPINEKIKATSNLDAAIENAEYIILCTPSKVIIPTLREIVKRLDRKVYIINTTKGFCEETNGLLSNAIVEELKNEKMLKDYVAIYGPSIASECIERKPTCLMSCAKKMETAQHIAELFSNEYFKVTPTTNIIACEVSAAAKNSLAIISGMASAMLKSDNSVSSLVSLGNLEILELAKYFGASETEYMNHSTIGDLILTTMSPKSRNYSLGVSLATTDNPKKVLEESKMTAEGVLTCKIIHEILQKSGIKSKLFANLYEILYNYKRPSIMINKFF